MTEEKNTYILRGLPWDILLALIMKSALYAIQPDIIDSSLTPIEKLGVFLAVVVAFIAFYCYFAMKIAPWLMERTIRKWNGMKTETRYLVLIYSLAICALFSAVYAIKEDMNWGAFMLFVVFTLLVVKYLQDLSRIKEIRINKERSE